MQSERNRRSRRDASVTTDDLHRTRPQSMPTQAPPGRGDALRGAKKPQEEPLPIQKPLTDDDTAEVRPAKWKQLLVRIGAGLLLALVLALAYVFLLLGEPEEDSAYTRQAPEETIQMPISALESPGEGNLPSLAETFGQPVMSLYGSALSMQRSRIYDTAFRGGYARRVTLTYAFEDGQTLTVESIRPTAAVTLLAGSGYTLDADSLFAIGGVDAAWMENGTQICVFGQTGTAAYAVLCPQSHKAELETLLKQTALTAPGE